METLNTISQFIPTEYAKYLLLLPLAGRAYHAIKNGGGLVGVWKSIMFGTSVQKKEEVKP